MTKITDSSNNFAGYEGGGNAITYDANGNMKDMRDKGILGISYNYLNLPKSIHRGFEFNIRYLYRADGVKLNKITTENADGNYGTVTITSTTDYLDGFQYFSKIESGGQEPPGGGDIIDTGDEGDEEEAPLAAAATRRAMEEQAFTPELSGRRETGIIATVNIKIPDLQFFPTAEGFYDYQKDQYIYQYKDHLGNARISFGRNSAGALEITDANDYYPFGMNHFKTGSAFFGQGSYKSYKYNGKELQETGMYDYGARFYMPDIGRWGVVDPLAEKSRRFSTYTYALDNPIMFVDPDGRQAKDIFILTANGAFKASQETMYKTPEGKRLWDKYGNSKTDDIYISSKDFGTNSSTVAGTMSDVRSKGLIKLSTERITIASSPSYLKDLDEFNDLDVSQSKGRKIHLISLNENFFKKDSSEKGYSTTIEAEGESHSIEYDNYDLAEAIYHEIKAHIEDGVGSGAEQDHTNYGSTYFRLERKRTPGSPAEVIQNQLVKLREDEKKQNNEIGSN